MGLTFYTLGHSTRSLSEFLTILNFYEISAIADVRAFPTSQRFPHFSQDLLALVLDRAGIKYLWLGRELGGYRKGGLGISSPNTAWRSQGFRNYADHMLTEEFQAGVGELLRLGEKERAAILCAERFWWRCHRRLLADWLVAHGHRVIHIVEINREVEHKLSPFARVEEGRVIYPGGDPWSPGCGKGFFRRDFRAGRPGA